jgi:hypothetical protein
MKKILFLSLILSSSVLSLWAASSNPTPALSLASSVVQWNKCSNDNGLTTYWSKVEGNEVIAFKGKGLVNAPIEKVASVLIDTTRGTEWVNSLAESKVVRTISEHEFIEYDHAGIPFPFDSVISDRDFVSDVTLKYDRKNGWFTVSYKPIEDAGAPKLKKYTRGVMDCEFRIAPMSMSGETYVEATVFVDPKGGIPKWLVNFFQQGWPQDTFEGLRRQCAKTDVKVLPVIENWFGENVVKTSEK